MADDQSSLRPQRYSSGIATTTMNTYGTTTSLDADDSMVNDDLDWDAWVDHSDDSLESVQEQRALTRHDPSIADKLPQGKQSGKGPFATIPETPKGTTNAATTLKESKQQKRSVQNKIWRAYAKAQSANGNPRYQAMEAKARARDKTRHAKKNAKKKAAIEAGDAEAIRKVKASGARRQAWIDDMRRKAKAGNEEAHTRFERHKAKSRERMARMRAKKALQSSLASDRLPENPQGAQAKRLPRRPVLMGYTELVASAGFSAFGMSEGDVTKSQQQTGEHLSEMSSHRPGSNRHGPHGSLGSDADMSWVDRKPDSSTDEDASGESDPEYEG